MIRKILENLKLTPNKLLDLTNDYVFFNIFGTPGAEPILINLLNDVLDLNGPDAINYIEIKNVRLGKELVEQREIYIDIYAESHNKRIFDIEMQNSPYTGMKNRAWGQLCKLSSTKIEKGESFLSDSPQVYIIVFCNYNESEIISKPTHANNVWSKKTYYREGPNIITHDRWHEVYWMANRETGEPLNQLGFIHFIDLPKLTREALNGADRSARWGLVVKEFRNIDLMEEIEMQTSVVREVFSRLGRMSLSEEERRLADMRAIAISIAKTRDEQLEYEMKLRKEAEEKSKQAEEERELERKMRKQAEKERNMFMKKYIQSMLNLGKDKVDIMREIDITEEAYQTIMDIQALLTGTANNRHC